MDDNEYRKEYSKLMSEVNRIQKKIDRLYSKMDEAREVITLLRDERTVKEDRMEEMRNLPTDKVKE